MTDISAIALRVLGPRATVLGSVDALENYITNRLPDGAICWVTAAGARYRFNSTSTDVPDGDLIVQPIAGPGRWFKETGGGGDSAIKAVYVAQTSAPVEVGTAPETILTEPVGVAAGEAVIMWVSLRVLNANEVAGPTAVFEVDNGEDPAFAHPAIDTGAFADSGQVEYASDMGADDTGSTGTLNYTLTCTSGSSIDVEGTMMLIVIDASILTVSPQP
jgi:hypothetical protein